MAITPISAEADSPTILILELVFLPKSYSVCIEIDSVVEKFTMLRFGNVNCKLSSGLISNTLAFLELEVNPNKAFNNVDLPVPIPPVIPALREHFIIHLQIVIGIMLFSSTIRASGESDGVESNFLAKKHQLAATGGLATAIREPSFMVPTTIPFRRDSA